MGSSAASSPAVAGPSVRASSIVRRLSSASARRTASTRGTYQSSYVTGKVHKRRERAAFVRLGSSRLQAEVAQARVILRPGAGAVPAELAVGLVDRHVIDARVPLGHEAVGGELPVLFPGGGVPVPAFVVPLVGEPYRDAVAGVGPQLLDQPVFVLAAPLVGQERDDLRPTVDELRAVTPAAI